MLVKNNAFDVTVVGTVELPLCFKDLKNSGVTIVL
jgi:hypothetical protein